MAHKLSIYLNDEEWEFLKDYAKRSRKSDKKFAKDYPDYPQNYEPLTMKNIAPEFKQNGVKRYENNGVLR